MSSDPDRISVPTNGKRPHPAPATAAPPTTSAPPGTTPGDLPGGLSPQQLAVGFGIIAWLLVIVAGLARRRLRR